MSGPSILNPGERWVRCSDDLAKKLSHDWSQPVQFRVTEGQGNVVELTFRTHTCSAAETTLISREDVVQREQIVGEKPAKGRKR